ncbi:MAG TPA: tripartite tricarboxylate transporter substrate-binding protein, partial [Hyphomicrobiaceae bacterium]|nr:tripartite tricarboxylate transporter substrate-binding protein [Hyphomicrobiaceae bacterium]
MRKLGWAILMLAAFFAPAIAQEFPVKPIRLVIPYPPGGPTDVVGRTYAAKMQEMWGQPVVVENRSGANGNIASQLVAKAPGDGYTMLLHASSFIINPLLYTSPGYDPFKEFTPISLTFDYKLVVVVNPSFPVNSI